MSDLICIRQVTRNLIDLKENSLTMQEVTMSCELPSSLFLHLKMKTVLGLDQVLVQQGQSSQLTFCQFLEVFLHDLQQIVHRGTM